jgi:protein arginine kinase activator
MSAKMCDECGKNPANVHLTQIVNDETAVFHLCEACARGKGIHISIGDGDQPRGLNTREQQILCPECGLSLADFREKGWLGCAHCYRAFEKEIDELLMQVHGARVHKGKTYRIPDIVSTRGNDIQKLRRELDNAIRNEKFELAATIRDTINSLINSGSLKEDQVEQ